MTTIAVSNSVSTDEDGSDLSTIAIISGAVVGALLLVIITIILVTVILCMKFRRTCNDIETVSVELCPYHTETDHSRLQQHTHSPSCQRQGAADVDTTSNYKLETTNMAYVPTKVNSLDSLLHRLQSHHTSSDDIIITPNPSYHSNVIITPNTSYQLRKESEHHCDYELVQQDDYELVQHDGLVTTSERTYEVIDPSDSSSHLPPAQ